MGKCNRPPSRVLQLLLLNPLGLEELVSLSIVDLVIIMPHNYYVYLLDPSNEI